MPNSWGGFWRWPAYGGLATSSVGTISVWKELIGGVMIDSDKEPVATCVLAQPISDLCWCPDGYSLLISTLQGKVMNWKIPSKLLGEKEDDLRPPAQLPRPVTSLIERPLQQEALIEPAMRRGPGKRIAPQRIEEVDELEATPGKRRRLGSLIQKLTAQTASIKNHFRIPFRCRRSEKKTKPRTCPYSRDNQICFPRPTHRPFLSGTRN